MGRQLRGLPAGIYVRISDDREGRELGVERQEEDCRRLADRLGVRVVGVYKDNDLSASTRSRKRRPEYQRLLSDARLELVKVIIAYTSSRITRKPREHEDLIDLAVDHGTWFEYLKSPSLDLNTADGRRIARMLAANDAGEAEATAERVARAKLQTAQAGKSNGGGRAYGYEDDHITIRENEALIIKECVARLIAGESQMALVRSLNERGILTTTGKKWMVSNLRRMLLKKRHVIGHDDGSGIVEHHSGEYKAEWQGIVTLADYELMLARFKHDGQPWAHGLANGRRYLLSGLARCGRCGAAMYGQARRRDNGRHQRRYRCKGLDNYALNAGCGKVFRDANALDEFVAKAILLRFDSPDIARVLTPDEDSQPVDELVKELTRLNTRRKTLAAEHALNPYDDYDIMRATVMTEIGRVETELGKLQSARARLLIPTDQPMRAAWEKATLEWKRDVIRLVVEKIVVRPSAPGAMMWNGHRFDPEAIDIRWKV